MMKFDARDRANCAYLNVITGKLSAEDAIHRFGLHEQMGRSPARTRGERHLMKGSQNYDITARALALDIEWFLALYDNYKAYGLHSKEFSPVYLMHHIMAWLYVWRMSRMPEAAEVLRATWAVLTAMSWPIVPDRWELTGAVEENGSFDGLGYGGPYVLTVGERTNEGSTGTGKNPPFTPNSAFLAAALDIEFDRKGWLDRPRHFPMELPDAYNMVRLSDNTRMPVSQVRMGPWWLRAIDNATDPMAFVVEASSLGLTTRERDHLLDMFWGGSVEALSYVTFPYLGELRGCFSPEQTSVVNMRQLNGNKPPIEAGYVTNEMVSLIRAGTQRGVAARGGLVTIEGETVVVTSNNLDGWNNRYELPFPASDDVRWIWNRDGFSCAVAPSVADLAEEIVSLTPTDAPPAKKGIFRKLIDWVRSLF